MTKKKIFGTAVVASLLLATSLGTVMAQDAAATNDVATDRAAVEAMDDDRDDGFDWGLLGLLGLLGLIPRKQSTVVHHDTRPTGTGTPR